VRVFWALAAGITVLILGVPAVPAGTQDPVLDCLSEDNERRISGCSALIATPGLPPEQLSLAYGLRALAYSLKLRYDQALADYDKAIDLNPDFAVALNNRAWLYYKTGRLEDGIADVEHALRLAPASPYALDTRAHIRQLQGATREAVADYESAMRFGGRPVVKMYQCGLRSQGVYSGALDGIYSEAVSSALRSCVSTPHCDPLPDDSECRPTVS
jgi:tetratricopeptide (TPR) repeat protein